MMGFHFLRESIMMQAALLIALGLGYIVCYFASLQERYFRLAGYAIGVFMITISSIFIVTLLTLGVRLYTR